MHRGLRAAGMDSGSARDSEEAEAVIGVTQEEFESERPSISAAQAVEFCLTQLYRDRRHRHTDELCHHLTYEELIGALLLARDEFERAEAIVDAVDDAYKAEHERVFESTREACIEHGHCPEKAEELAREEADRVASMAAKDAMAQAYEDFYGWVW